METTPCVTHAAGRGDLNDRNTVHSEAAAKAAPPQRDWVLRSYDPDGDRDSMHQLLGVAYTRSRAGQRAGAPSDRKRGEPIDPEAAQKRQKFLDEHEPIWSWLLAKADVLLAVDRDEPRIIWGWLITSAPNILHAVGAKRTVVDAGIAPDVVRDLLGDRLTSHQVCSLELPQMRTRGTASVGIDRPRDWSMDPTWLVSRMVSR